MENKSNFYHWPTTVWLSSPNLCSSEDEARPHTEAKLQHFEKKKNFNGKSQMDFQIGGGRPCSSLLTQLLQRLNFESKAPRHNHELALPFFWGCRTGNIQSTAQLDQKCIFSVFYPTYHSLQIDPAVYENKNKSFLGYIFHKIILASEWIY